MSACSASKIMTLSIPTEAEIIELATFLRSLQTNQLDNDNITENDNIPENDSFTENEHNCDIPSPVAFEEVEHAPSLSVSISSKSTIWDINDSEVSEYYKKLTHANTCSEAEVQLVPQDDCQPRNEIVADSSNVFSDISSTIINNLQINSSCKSPFKMIQGRPFHLFNFEELDRATDYTHFFKSSNRHAAYYGEFSYSYGKGKTLHSPKPIANNDYLQKIASYVQIVLPGFKFNSAMVHKYQDGQSFIPHHGDDEEEIVEGSEIVTISLGETRYIEFQSISSASKTIQKLTHGDIFIMEKSSQTLFTHSIPPDVNPDLKPRLSVTFRLISGPKSRDKHSLISSVSALSPTNTVTDFLMDLDQSPEGYVGDVTITPPFPEQQLPTISKPKLLDNIHPSRLKREPENISSQPTLERNTKEQVLYISSSMFPNIDPVRLSSKDQEASKLFYPGADAGRMLHRIKNDQNFVNLQKNRFKKIFILTGSNNIDTIQNNNSSIRIAVNDIIKLLQFVRTTFPNAVVNVLNILPRQSRGRWQIIKSINHEIKQFCEQAEKFTFIDTYYNFMFSNHDGSRRNNFFMSPGNYGPDNVHLNAVGVVRLGKHLKFLAHQN